MKARLEAAWWLAVLVVTTAAGLGVMAAWFLAQMGASR